jgi:uncharacterized membrane protein (UPF0127 family)
MDRTGPLRSDGWLVHGSTVLASAQIARTRAERRRGLLGRTAFEGVMVLPVRSVHTLGMRCTIDVVFCAADGTIVRTVTLPPGRPACWARGARFVVEAPGGAVAGWGIAAGDVLEVRQ